MQGMKKSFSPHLVPRGLSFFYRLWEVPILKGLQYLRLHKNRGVIREVWGLFKKHIKNNDKRGKKRNFSTIFITNSC